MKVIFPEVLRNGSAGNDGATVNDGECSMNIHSSVLLVSVGLKAGRG